MTEPGPTDRARVKRLPDLADYDVAVINAILDEALVCHVGFIHDGSPVVIPTIHARSGTTLYIHGSPASRMLRAMKNGVDVCVTMTIVDGLIIARAPFHSSLSYRSVVVFGTARAVVDIAEKREAFRIITEHVAPGRWDDARLPNESETRRTSVLAVPLSEASAKVSVGPPEDDAADYDLPLWAGEIPLRTVAGPPVPDPALRGSIEVPPYLADYQRPGTS